MPALLEAHNLVRRQPFGDRRLLEDISLALHPGDRAAVAGPSGSGKTLLLRALSLLDPIDSGRVLWHGQPIRNQEVPGFRCRAIYFHQRPAFLPRPWNRLCGSRWPWKSTAGANSISPGSPTAGVIGPQ